MTLYGRGHVVFGLEDGNIEIRDIFTGDIICEWKWYENLQALVFTSDGKLVSGSVDGFLTKWDMKTWVDKTSPPKEQWSKDAGDNIYGVSELTDGRLVFGGDQGVICVLDGVTGEEIMVCRGHTAWMQAVISLGVLHSDSFASASGDETIRVWARDGTLLQVVEVGVIALSLTLSPCGGFVAAACGGGSVKVYRLPDWDLVWKDGSVKVHEASVSSVSWSPDGHFLALGSYDRMVQILSADTGSTLRTLGDNTSWVTSVLFSQDGTKVLSGSFGNTIHVQRLCEHDDRIASLLSDRSPSDLVYQGEDVFYQLFKKIRQKLIG